jgi:hypothetical protein
MLARKIGESVNVGLEEVLNKKVATSQWPKVALVGLLQAMAAISIRREVHANPYSRPEGGANGQKSRF